MTRARDSCRTRRSRFFLLLLLLLLGARPAAAQVDEGAFIVLVGADTLAVENFSRRPDGLSGEITGRGIGRVAYTATLAPDGAVVDLTLSSWAPGAALDSSPAQTARVSVQRDTVVMEVPGATGVQRLPTEPGTFIYLNPSFLLTEQLVMHARTRESGVAEIPVFVIHAGSTVTARVTNPRSASVRISMMGSEFQAAVDAGGRLRGAVVPAQSLSVLRVDGHLPPLAIVPPDYSAPDGAPYEAEEVVVESPDGHRLAGTLTRPRGAEMVPAVITITGSGAQDRDQSIAFVRGYRPFREIADTLGQSGIAVLRLDDRGYGGSTGNFASATSEDFAGDVRAAIAYLRTRPDIDGERIALVGHSEGGLIAPLVAAADPALRAIVLIAGPARTGREILDYQIRYGIETSPTIPEAERDSAFQAAMAQLETQAARQPWLRSFLAYDPLPTARAITRTPVLILHGATDRQVTADQAEELAEAFRSAGNPDVTVRVFPGINHLMLPDPDGGPGGYPRLQTTRIDRELLGALVDWMVDRLR